MFILAINKLLLYGRKWHVFILFQIEDIITKMQDDKTGGVPIRTVKSFLSKIPSVVTGKHSPYKYWWQEEKAAEELYSLDCALGCV